MNTNPQYVKISIIAVAAISLGLLVFFLVSLIPQRVTIAYKHLDGAAVKIFKVDSAEELHDVTDDKTIGKEVNSSVTGDKDIFLQRGAYVISVSGNNIQKKQYPLEVTGTVRKEITINYSRKYLDSLVKEAEPIITTSLKKALPTLETSYFIRPGKLYQRGDWYTARLRYIGTDSSSRDTLRVVMKKNDTGAWELVTKTPEIIVTYPKYPSIPAEVVEDVNSDESLQITPSGE